jgi:hypothetical protein
MMAALLATVAGSLIAASAASASGNAVVYDGMGGFEEVAVYVYPYAIQGEHVEEISMCLQLSNAQHEYLTAHDNAPLAWAIVAEQSCVSVFRDLGTVTKAVAEKNAQEQIGPARREESEREGANPGAKTSGDRKHRRQRHRRHPHGRYKAVS